jgi:molybdenum cofactor cytidylyltransferase
VSVAAVVLAAGASRRLGRPKQNIMLNGETLLHRAVRVAREACLSPIIVVVRAGSEYGGTPDSDGSVIAAVNHQANEGLASSIRHGIHLASSHDVAGVVILACDQPALRPDHLRALVEDERRVTGSTYAGTIGIPAYFPATSFSVLLQLRGDTGARKLLLNAHPISAEDLQLDIDTEEDLVVARTLLEQE